MADTWAGADRPGLAGAASRHRYRAAWRKRICAPAVMAAPG
ncbi:MAG TPA: hypothetical protein VIF60_16945 [Burkholderiaceae bacterium]